MMAEIDQGELCSDSFWDNLDTGSWELDHSENFFAKKHLEHERIRTPNTKGKQSNKENNQNFQNQNPSNKSDDEISNELAKKLDKCLLEPDSPKTETNKILIKKSEEKDNIKPVGPVTRSKAKAVIVSKLPTHGNAVPTFCGPKSLKLDEFNVCRYAKTYADRKQRRLACLEAEAKKAREFHSKPPPDFKKIHKKMAETSNDHKKLPVCPMTPEVLKKSIEAEERRIKKLEEYMRQQQPIQFVAKDCDIVKKRPYKPKLEKHTIQMNPFELHMTTRLQQRKRYDDLFQKFLEEKARQNEEEERQKEIQLRKNLRKMAEFKAKPNPFH